MQYAECVVGLGATELFAELRDVEKWPRFLEPLESVTPVGHRRYRWTVDRGRTAEIDVVVSFDHRRRTITWMSLQRHAFDGGFRLVPVTAQRTRVHCRLAIAPVGVVQTLLVGPHLTEAMASVTVQRLAQHVAAQHGGAEHGGAEHVGAEQAGPARR